MGFLSCFVTLCLDSNRAYSMSPRDCAGLAIGLPTALSCPLLLFCKPCLPACDSLDFQGLLSGPVPCAPLFCPQRQGTGPVLRKHLIESVNPTLMCIVQGKVVHDSDSIILWVKFGWVGCSVRGLRPSAWPEVAFVAGRHSCTVASPRRGMA